MLIHPTVERLRALGLSAMAEAFIEMQNAPEAAELTREDWLGLLGRSRSDQPQRTSASPAVCVKAKLATGRRRRGRQSSRAARSRPRPIPKARHLRVGPRSSPFGGRRSDRAGDMMRYLTILLERHTFLSCIE